MGLKRDWNFQASMDLAEMSDRVAVVNIPKKPRKKIPGSQIVHDTNDMLWCGPAAISALTGAATSEVRDLVRKYRKDPSSAVTGTTGAEIEYALDRLGYKMEAAYIYGGRELAGSPVFGQWINSTKGELLDNIGYLIGLFDNSGRMGHWALILNGQYICSKSARWVPLDKAQYRRHRVSEVYAIRRK